MPAHGQLIRSLELDNRIDLHAVINKQDQDKRDTGAREVRPLSRSVPGQRRLPASAILAAVAGWL
jgi:hypothetical protein